MKPKPFLRSFLAALGGSIIAISSASAATLYWDGTDTSANADGGASSPGVWDNGTTSNWDTLAFGGSNSVWTNGAHTAVFGGAAAVTATPVTIGTGGVTVGGLTFNANNYVINAAAEGLTFSSGTNVIQSYIGNNGDTTATITGLVSGTGSNIVLSSGTDQRISTLNLNGTSAGGWDGTTTINAGSRMSLSVSNQALFNTTGITLNGGNILLANTATGSENTLDRVKDDTAIASYGSTSITIANTATASRLYSETIGAITHYNGQLGIGFNTVQNQAGNTQTLNVNGLTNSGGTSTIAINSSAAAGAMHGNSYIRISGIANETPAGEIVGHWMTAGGINTQSDWAVYTTDVVSGYRRIGSKGGTAVAETLWASSSATGNYNASAPAPTTGPVNNKLTANRFVNTLRGTFAELTSNVGANWSIDGTPGVEKVNFATHALVDGDVVHFRSAPTGLQDNRPYYVINAIAGTSFQLSLTPGGTAIDLTSATSGFMSTGINLNGNTLGLNGYINAGTGTAAIGGGSASTLTLATATTGNLYVHGAASMWIDPSIKDNGAGVLTLVKSGTTTLGLSGDNTYTGGTVINGGTINFATAGSWVSGQNITFDGAGSITASVGTLSGGILDIDQGAVGVISGSSVITFTTTTGAGKLVYAGGGTGAGSLNMGNASAFTGDLQVSNQVGSNPYPSIIFPSIGDAAGSSIQYGGGQADSNQRAIIAYEGSSALTLSNRQIQLLPRGNSNNVPRRSVMMNNSTNASHKLVIEQNLLNTVDRTSVEFQLDGSNTGNNEFSGDIGDSTYSAIVSPSQFALNVYKNGAGKWILSGDNTFTGRLLVSQGTLSVGTFNDSTTAGPLGKGSIIQLGGAEAAPVINGSGLALAVVLSGNNSGTLEYTGGAASTSRTFQIGSNATGTHTGGGTIANNGGGALTFTAANLNDAIAGVSVARTLTLAGSNTGNNEVQGIIRDNVLTTGKINLAKSGAGTWTLTGPNTYTGTTTVSAGKLTIGVTNCLADTSNVMIGAGALSVGAGFSDTVGTLDCTGAATINLANSSSKLAFLNSNGVGGNWGANTLTITGTFVPGNGTDPGNPGSLRFGIDNTGLSATQLGKITAPGWTSFGLDAFGYLTATPSGGSAYDTWKAANAPGSNPDDDTDGDGVTNAVEFVLGGTSATDDLGKLPIVAASGTDMTFTFVRDETSADAFTAVTIEVSTDLVNWNAGSSPYAVPNTATGPVNPGVTVVDNGATHTVTLTIQKAPDTKKFARLKVVITP